jgi:hypothetical protein
MRVYLPVTLPELAGLRSADGLPPADDGRPGYAVTPAVREWYTSGDTEELEFSALTDAAEASLRLVAHRPGTPARRVVLAADVPDAAVRPVAGPVRSLVEVAGAVPLADIASIHLDEAAAEQVVAAAAAALPAADDGDDDALFLLDEAQAHDLLWYDITELDHLG